MQEYISLYVGAVFVALTPGILLTVPKGGSKIKVAIAHALLFAAIIYFTRTSMLKFLSSMEGFQTMAAPPMPIPTPGAGSARPAAGAPMMPMPGGMPGSPPAAGSGPSMPAMNGGPPMMPPGAPMTPPSGASKWPKGQACESRDSTMCPSNLCINGVCV